MNTNAGALPRIDFNWDILKTMIPTDTDEIVKKTLAITRSMSAEQRPDKINPLK